MPDRHRPQPHEPGESAAIPREEAVERRTGRRVAPGPSARAPAESVHATFERQALRRPDASAIVSGHARSSYSELNAAANRLARRIVAASAGEDRPVALLLPPGIDCAVAILAVLKAGRACVPLEPSDPLPRLKRLMRMAGARLIVSEPPRLELAGELADRPEDVLDASAPSEGSSENLGLDIPAAALAIFQFTSGSTGEAKAVRRDHGDLLIHFERHVKTFGLVAEDRLVMLSRYSHVGCVNNLLRMLLNGGTALWYDLRGEGLAGLAEWMREESATILHAVPAVFRMLAGSLGPDERLESLRLVHLGGETLRSSDVELVRRHCAPSCVLFNVLGSTETSLVCVHRIERSTPVEDGVVPVGRPVQDLEVLVLDAAGEPCPVGELGEICVTGPGLGGAEELHHTGDLGFLDAAGLLHHRGRSDLRVKVRGYGVDLGEVELALVGHPSVAAAAVLPRIDPAGTTHLDGLIVPASAARGLDFAELREHLRSVLPEYMVPTSLEAVADLPLAASGKIDRSALAKARRGADRREQRKPREDEAGSPAGVLGEIFRATLGLESVGPDASFFDLGGDSLLAMRALVEVEERLGVRVPMRRFFEGPSLAELARTLEEQAREASPALPQVAPAGRRERYPASFSQRRLWFLDQLEPGNPAYNLSRACELRGALDRAALDRALAALTRRHAALRTRIVPSEGEPYQIVSDEAVVDHREVDLSASPAAEAEARLEALRREEAVGAFDLARSPLQRSLLVRLAPERHVLVVSAHHVISDAWSNSIIWSDLLELYSEQCGASEETLPETELRFTDYSTWQREQLDGPALAADEAYWRHRFEDEPPPLELPLDRLRSAARTSLAGYRRLELGAEAVERLKALGRAQGATLFMTLLSGLHLLLSRWSRQRDIVIGVPVANRHHPGTAEVVGFFANTLALRVRGDELRTFSELLASVKELTLDAYAHQEYPFERLVELVNPARDRQRTPLFQVTFSMIDPPRRPGEAAGLEIVRLPRDQTVSPFDLAFDLSEREGRATIGLRFRSELFEAVTAEGMLSQLGLLLEQVAADPDRELAGHAMLTEQERRRLLVEWNDNAAPYPRKALHAVFADQAERTPEAPALVFGDRELDYRELDELAGRAARRLRALGAGPGRRVATCIERSSELVVAILAIVKTGAAYVPLDPHHPVARLAGMVADAEAGLVVGHADRHLDEELGARVADVGELLAQGGDEGPAFELGPTEVGLDDLAYVMYTSGSTGIPSGVAVPHRGVMRLIFGMAAPPLDGPQRLLWTTPPSFDASVFELWGALLRGGCSVPVRDRVPTASVLRDLIATHRADSAWLTGSLFNHVVEESPEALKQLQWLVIGGEALSVEHVRRFRRTCPTVRLFNGYGPTEATVFTCLHEIRDVPPAWASSIPIGRTPANTRVYVLDQRGQPVPVGVPGELFVGGDGLALGYLNLPELTARRFVRSELPEEPGERLYRTGDLVRWLPGGDLEYLGRMDLQAKIRGHRIELGEIEVVLSQLPGVAECAVVVDEEGGSPRLVAYVVPKQGSDPPERDALRRALSERLPAYMIPAAFATLGALPLTPNGKLDRAALPAPAREERGPPVASAPQTAVEAALLDIWEEVLGLTVGRDDDFFELGGTSMQAIRAIDRAHDWGLLVTPTQLFQAPTVAELAPMITTRPAVEGGEDSPLVALRTDGTREPLFFMPSAPGDLLGYGQLVRTLGPDQPCYGFQGNLLGGLDPEEGGIEELAAHFTEALLAFRPKGPYHLVGWCFGGILAVETAQQLRRKGCEVGLVALIDAFPRQASMLGRRLRSAWRLLRSGRRAIPWLLERWRPEGRAPKVDPALHFALDLESGPFANRTETYRRNMASLKRYRSVPYPGRIVLCKAIEEGALSLRDPDNGWKAFAAELEVHVFPARHENILGKGRNEGLADLLRRPHEARPR